AEKKARANVLSSVESIARSMMNQLKIKPKPEIRKKIQNRIIENIRQTHFSVNMPNKGLDLPDDLSDDSRAFANETADAIAKSAAVILGRPSSGKHVSAFETTVLSMKEWADGAFEYQQEFGDEPFQSEAEEEENFNNNDLFYTEDMLDTIDTFPTDSKKFFDMMEKLAEYRMRREDAIIDAIEIDQPTVLELIKAASASSAASEKGIDSITQSLMRRARDSMHPQRRCPDCHGEISDAEDKADGSESFQNPQAIKSSRVHSDLGSSGAKDSKSSVYYDLGDSEYEDGTDDDNPESDVYSDSDDYEKYEVYSDGSISEDDECDEDDDYDDDYDRDKAEEDLAILDSLDADHEAEESRKVFQLFAARLFEQRVINAYRENIAHNRQEDLIKELEEEEKQQQAKEKRKQRKKEREKEKKR
ncbi:Stress response protein nst1, partial [Coemansia sp. RSA 2607]